MSMEIEVNTENEETVKNETNSESIKRHTMEKDAMEETEETDTYSEVDNETKKEDLAVIGVIGGNHKVKYNLNVDLFGRKAVWGTFLILGAVALLAGKLGYLDFAGFSFWTIVWTVFFIAALVAGITKMRVGQTLFSLAFLVIIHDELLGLEAITPWPVLGAALLITIGIKMIFPKSGKHSGSFITVNGVPYKKGESYSEETRKGNKISYENAFGESVKYVIGEVSRVDIENVFGTTQVYFSDALPVEGSLRIDLENCFGRTVLYIPATWKVRKKTEAVCGSVTEKGHSALDGSIDVFIDAETVFGSVEVRYI